MTGEPLGDVTTTQGVVLAALVESTADRSTPVNPAELRSVCNDALAATDGPVVGGLSEADVTRALYALESDGHVENVADETSPAGKGRPAYELRVDRESVLAELSDRDGFDGLVARAH
jgi:hypothetical protein